MQSYDAIIIGFGKGGKTLAGRLASAGRKTALIEQSPAMYGGTCINVGCIPSKSLVGSAAFSLSQGDEPFEVKSRRYREAVAEKRRVTGFLRAKNYDKLAGNKNATVIDGQARFTSPTTVEVTTATETLSLQAPQIFINTGSVSVVPKIEGVINNPKVYFSDGLMALDELPERLTIIGGGYIGLEFASMYQSFGSKVTVLQDGDVFLPREDADVATEILKLLTAQGINVLTGAQIKRLDVEGNTYYDISGETHLLPADAILVATGRRPNTDALNAAAANVQLTPRGAVSVDELLKTSQSGIWAMGDVVGGLQFTYVSLDDYRVVERQILGGEPYTTDMRKNVPYGVFMKTPFSRVGLGEREAAAQNLNFRVVKMPAAAVPKAQVLRKTEGFLKALIDNETGRILGASLLCELSYEMINIVKLAMDLNADYKVLRDQIFTHPTMSEALNDLFSL